MRFEVLLEGICVKAGKTKAGKDYADVIKFGDSKIIRIFGLKAAEGEKIYITVAVNADIGFAISS